MLRNVKIMLNVIFRGNIELHNKPFHLKINCCTILSYISFISSQDKL